MSTLSVNRNAEPAQTSSHPRPKTQRPFTKISAQKHQLVPHPASRIPDGLPSHEGSGTTLVFRLDALAPAAPCDRSTVPYSCNDKHRKRKQGHQHARTGTCQQQQKATSNVFSLRHHHYNDGVHMYVTAVTDPSTSGSIRETGLTFLTCCRSISLDRACGRTRHSNRSE